MTQVLVVKLQPTYTQNMDYYGPFISYTEGVEQYLHITDNYTVHKCEGVLCNNMALCSQTQAAACMPCNVLLLAQCPV